MLKLRAAAVATAFALAIALMLSAGIVRAQPTADPFREQVERTYNFEPKNLSSAELPVKAKDLDRFWAFVRQSPQQHLPKLRSLLASDSAPTPFFYFDGARLLLSLSRSVEDKRLAASAIAKSDPASVNASNYADVVHSLSAQDIDAADAALNILNQKDFEFAIPEHAGGIPMPQHLLNQQEALILMLAPAAESTYVAKAGTRLNSEQDPIKQIALLKLIWFAVTAEGDSIIAKFANGETGAEKARQVARTALKSTIDLSGKPPLSPYSAADLRSQRRSALARISEENFRKYYSLSYALRTARE